MIDLNIQDLAGLPAPTTVESIDYEKILTEIREDLLIELQTDFPNIINLLESDSLSKLVQVYAYRELYFRQAVNEAIKGIFITKAKGDDLENLINLFELSVTENQSDDDAREQFYQQLALFSTVGSRQAYAFHIKQAFSEIKDVFVTTEEGSSTVNIYLLAKSGDGNTDDIHDPETQVSLTEQVEAYLQENEEIRPITDFVQVNSANIIHYRIEAELFVAFGPGADKIQFEAEKTLRAYALAHHRLNHAITLSGLQSALQQPGVESINISFYKNNEIETTESVDDILIAPEEFQAPYSNVDNDNTAIKVSIKVFGESVVLPPFHIAKSIEFTDESSEIDKIKGTVYIEPADIEDDLTHYILYWGETQTDLIEEIALIPKENKDNEGKLNVIIEDENNEAIEIPEEANYFIVRTAYIDNAVRHEMETGISQLIIDAPPQVNAKAINFTDEDATMKQISGEAIIERAKDEFDNFDEDYIDNYLLVWAKEEGQTITRLIDEEIIATLAKPEVDNVDDNIIVELDKLAMPQDATHLAVLTEYQAQTIEESQIVATPIYDFVIPTNIATGMSFADESLTKGEIKGQMLIEAAEIDDDLTHYILYWGKSEDKLITTNAEINRVTKGILSIPIENNGNPISIPVDAKYFVLRTAYINEDNVKGEMTTGISIPIEDDIFSRYVARRITFADISLALNHLTGLVTIQRALDETGLTEYRLYWSADGITPDALIENIPVNSGDSGAVYFGLNLAKPPGVEYLLVLTVKDNIELIQGTSLPIVDNFTP